MPKVQRYDSPQVGNNPLPDTTARLNSSGAFGEQIGGGVFNVGQALGDIQARMQQEEDDAAVKEGTSTFRRDINQKTYLDEGAYYNLQGKAAFESYGSVQDDLDKSRKDISSKLTPRQRDKFDAISLQYLDRELDSMSRHAAKGRTTWHNEQDGAIISLAIEDGSLRYNDNGDYSEQIKKGVNNLAKRNGWTPERKEIEVEKNLSVMHKQAIDNAMVQNPSLAKEYFEKHKEEIAPSLHDDIQKIINSQVNAQWSQDNADLIRLSGGSLTSRTGKARELTKNDPEKRKELMSLIEHDYTVEKRAQQDAQTDIYNEFTQAAIDGASATELQLKQPNKWSQLSASQRTALVKNKDTKTDLGAYYELKGLMVGDKDAAKQFFIKNAAKFSHGDSKQIINDLQKPTKQYKGFISEKAAFDKAMEGITGKQPVKGDKRKKWNRQYNVFAGMYQEQLNSYKDTNNVDQVPEAERRKILDEFAIEVIRKDSFLGVDWLNPDEEMGINDIPVDDLEAIRDALESGGHSTTPDNIMQLYLSQ